VAVTRLFGSAVKRREDPRLITGRGTYTDDVKLPGMAYMAILRTPYAHARITRIDTTRAREHSGVFAVFTGKDLEGQGHSKFTVGARPSRRRRTAGGDQA
jgi:carbon-monoxide dehydrogenase large subunit